MTVMQMQNRYGDSGHPWHTPECCFRVSEVIPKSETLNILSPRILEILNILAPGALARDDSAAEIRHILALGLADEMVLTSPKEPSQISWTRAASSTSV